MLAMCYLIYSMIIFADGWFISLNQSGNSCYSYSIFSYSLILHAVLFNVTGFSLGLNDRAQRPVVLFSALSFFLSALSFFQRPIIFREPFGFFGLLSAFFWAWSCRKRPIKAKGGAIFVHHVIRVGHRRNLGFTSQISAWEWGYTNGIWRNIIFAIVYLESGAGIYEN